METNCRSSIIGDFWGIFARLSKNLVPFLWLHPCFPLAHCSGQLIGEPGMKGEILKPFHLANRIEVKKFVMGSQVWFCQSLIQLQLQSTACALANRRSILNIQKPVEVLIYTFTCTTILFCQNILNSISWVVTQPFIHVTLREISYYCCGM